MLAALPIEAVTTDVVRKGLLSLISFRIENIYQSMSVSLRPLFHPAYILMTCIGEHNHRKGSQDRDNALVANDMNSSSLFQRVSGGEMIDHEDDQICDGNERDDGGVL